jgi:hypothetical protein
MNLINCLAQYFGYATSTCFGGALVFLYLKSRHTLAQPEQTQSNHETSTFPAEENKQHVDLYCFLALPPELRQLILYETMTSDEMETRLLARWETVYTEGFVYTINEALREHIEALSSVGKMVEQDLVPKRRAWEPHNRLQELRDRIERRVNVTA